MDSASQDSLDFGLLRDQRSVRMHLAEASHYYFFHLYMSQYVKHPTARFQRELYNLTEDESIKHAVVVAFRGSGKSTIMTLSCPIWAVLGKQKKNFVVILSQTQSQARTHLTNIKREFETNELLRKDFGPLEEEADEWGSTALILSKFNARIVAASTEQSIRGIRFGAHRPDLIIADDVEDMNSVKTAEGRNKTYDWFSGEVLPLGDQNTKMITIGNLLHEDSLLMRLREKIEADEMTAVFKKFPLINSKNKCLWEGKYPNKQSLLDEEKKVGNPRAWQREYLLKIVPDDMQVIDPAWIKFYDALPDKTEANEYINTFIAVDLAISQKTHADYTAIVVVHAYGYKPEDRKYYVDRHYINRKLTFFQASQTIEELCQLFRSSQQVRVLVEKVSYQQAMVEFLESRKLDVKGQPVSGDKHARLMTAGMLFEQGRVYFPVDGACKQITNQLTGFGVEKHDDLVDALTLALNYINAKVKYGLIMTWLSMGPDDDDDEDDDIYGITYED